MQKKLLFRRLYTERRVWPLQKHHYCHFSPKFSFYRKKMRIERQRKMSLFRVVVSYADKKIRSILALPKFDGLNHFAIVSQNIQAVVTHFHVQRI